MASTLFQTQDHADLYSKFRPSPPEEFVQFIVKYMEKRIKPPFTTAVDVGCGTGQSTAILAPHFQKVVGVDVSEAQIQSATKDRTLPNVTYEVAYDTKLPFDNNSVQLIASCEAIHWFDLDKFYSEVRRVLVPSGVIAAYGYWIPTPYHEDEKKTNLMKNILEDLSEVQLAEYWSDVNNKRLIVYNRYVDLPFPFQDVERLDMVQKTESTLADYVIYLSTWSGFQRFFQKNKEDAEKLLKRVQNQLLQVLDLNKPPEEIALKLHSDFFILIGHV